MYSSVVAKPKPISEPSSPNVKSYTDHGYDWDAVPYILLYIDNSNIFENARVYSAIKKGYRNGIIDPAIRINVGKLITKAVGQRRLLFGKLYGSEPPAIQEVWDAITKNNVQVETFHRSKWTLQEKQVDTSIVADAVEDLIQEKERAGINRTLVLFSGDRDLNRVIEKARKYDYRVEIWSFKFSQNKDAVRMAEQMPDHVKILNMEDIFEEVSFTQFVFKDDLNIPRERSLVASVTLPGKCNKREILKSMVAKAGSLFRLPMMGKFLHDQQNILLVPCNKEIYTPHSSPSKSRNEKPAPIRIYDFYSDIQPLIPVLQEHFKEICFSILPWNEFLASQYPSSTCDILSATRFQKLKIINKDEQYETESGIHSGSDSDAEEFFDCANTCDTCPLNHKISADGFVPLVRKKSKTKRNIYSELCVHKFWCVNGLHCSYKHTDQEREFFKVQTNSKFRKLYKVGQCTNKGCQYVNKTYLCQFAHSLKEARCLSCGGGGKQGTDHWMDKCPLNTRVNVNKKG